MILFLPLPSRMSDSRCALRRIEDRLSELVVPPADASSRAAGSSSKGEVDILGTDTIIDKIVSTGPARLSFAPSLTSLRRRLPTKRRSCPSWRRCALSRGRSSESKSTTRVPVTKSPGADLHTPLQTTRGGRSSAARFRERSAEGRDR